uniref:glutamate-1-semialdehyde 2,1-aminomutase n=1 Tax=Chenopodium quinoa TaxID=63459 RepID=A0A803L0Z4_CHEQI
MTVSVDEKKKSYTLQKSEEAFAKAKVFEFAGRLFWVDLSCGVISWDDDDPFRGDENEEEKARCRFIPLPKGCRKPHNALNLDDKRNMFGTGGYIHFIELYKEGDYVLKFWRLKDFDSGVNEWNLVYNLSRVDVELMPGGVNSPVRAFKSVGGQPIVVDSVKGSHMWDIDGNDILTMLAHGDLLLLVMLTMRFHFFSGIQFLICHPLKTEHLVLAALAETMKKGTSFGAPCLLENTLAELVISAVPSIEMVRFVNSGTEACMGVLRLARAFTGRQKIIKFEGCYHGHADPFLVKAGSGVATLGLPDSPGVPKSATSDTLTSPYNDLETVKSLFEANKGEIAAIILEPVVGNSGFIPPNPGFLEALREISKENGTLLIFDEVMTGFRLSYGGAQEYFKITPDLTTLGKVIGGGLPVGAYGGRRDIMEMVAPAGPMYQAGTLSGNPLAMTAGIHTLKRLMQPGSYEYLDKITGELTQGLLDAGKKAGHAIFEDAKRSDTAKFGRFYRGMLEEGVYFAPSQFEAGFTSLAHTTEDIQQTIAAAEKGGVYGRSISGAVVGAAV